MNTDIVLGIDTLALITAIGLLLGRSLLAPAAGFWPIEVEDIGDVSWRLLGLCIGLLWLTSLAWLRTQAAAMSGQSYGGALAVIPVVLFHSHFGAVWWLRVAAMLWFTGAWVNMGRLSGRTARGGTYAVLFGLAWVAASRIATGHAAAAGDWTLREAMDWLHLISVSVWGGSLIATTLLIFPRLVRTDISGRAEFAQRFSRVAGCALAGVLLSGTYDAWQMLPAISAFWENPYGRLLGIKLLLVAAMVAFDAVHRYRRVSELRAVTAENQAAWLHRFPYSVLVETALFLGVLAITSMLFDTAPPR